jgi:hypothetical protein
MALAEEAPRILPKSRKEGLYFLHIIVLCSLLAVFIQAQNPHIHDQLLGRNFRQIKPKGRRKTALGFQPPTFWPCSG